MSTQEPADLTPPPARLPNREVPTSRTCPVCDGRGYTLRWRRSDAGTDYLLQVCPCHGPTLHAA